MSPGPGFLTPQRSGPPDQRRRKTAGAVPAPRVPAGGRSSLHLTPRVHRAGTPPAPPTSPASGQLSRSSQSRSSQGETRLRPREPQAPIKPDPFEPRRDSPHHASHGSERARPASTQRDSPPTTLAVAPIRGDPLPNFPARRPPLGRAGRNLRLSRSSWGWRSGEGAAAGQLPGRGAQGWRPKALPPKQKSAGGSRRPRPSGRWSEAGPRPALRNPSLGASPKASVPKFRPRVSASKPRPRSPALKPAPGSRASQARAPKAPNSSTATPKARPSKPAPKTRSGGCFPPPHPPHPPDRLTLRSPCSGTGTVAQKSSGTRPTPRPAASSRRPISLTLRSVTAGR